MAVLKRGDIAVATARNPSKLSFNGTTKDNYEALALDVTDRSSIAAAFEQTIKRFGRIDVVVNNAGYGLSGEFESLSESQIRTQMEVSQACHRPQKSMSLEKKATRFNFE